MSNQTFQFEDEGGAVQTMLFDDSEYMVLSPEEPSNTFVLNAQGMVTQLVPATALGLFNDTVMTGHDKGYTVKVTQADGTTVFPMTGIPINFYAKGAPNDTTLFWLKTLALNPLDVLVNTTAGVISVFVRAADIASLAVGTIKFLYVDVFDSIGNPWNIVKWTITINS